MIDYIDRQAVIDMFQRNAYDDWNQGVSTTWASAFSECADMVEDIPSADAVEVVRCKDCKYQDKGENESESWNVCNYRPWLYFSINDDDYCSNGEQKEEN